MIYGETFSPGSVSRHVSCAEYSVTSFEPANARTCLDNDAGEFPTQQDVASRFRVARLADESFTRIDPNGVNVGEHIEFTERRFRNVCQFDGEVFEAVRLLVDKGLHKENLSRNVSRIPVSKVWLWVNST